MSFIHMAVHMDTISKHTCNSTQQLSQITYSMALDPVSTPNTQNPKPPSLTLF